MKKLGTVLIILLLLLGTVWYFKGNSFSSATSSKAPHEKLHVIASSYVVYALAREIGADAIELSMLVPPGTEPHHFEPTPGTIIAISEADLFFYVSGQAEPWVKDILGGLSDVTAVETAAIEPDEDPHVWMTPYGALSMAKQIAAALSTADPSQKSVYQQNLKQFEKQIDRLHMEFEKGLSACKYRDVVHVGHLAFKPLTDTYGLSLQALTGTSEQGEHSVYKITGLVRFIRQKKLAAVFTEELVPPELANTIAQETGVRILPLYTIEEVGKADFDSAVTYTEYMRRNLHNLQEGLQCQA